uniref:Uncharacterized protein n=1 Tax=Nelumbo nucifera TaxID=4432 RepID=A0A822ZR85_NELNU|nr:TPA_asm: hypothetical protein HUJ06_017334 [Nelumbo nucifera]
MTHKCYNKITKEKHPRRESVQST